MQLNTLSPAPGARKKAKRVGRGIGSTDGKTCGRGHKGQKSRKGSRSTVGFEGGQMPLHRRLPKFGFNSHLTSMTQQIRLKDLNKLDGEVDINALKAANLMPEHKKRAKVFLQGNITKAITLKGIMATKGAIAAIEKAGGKIA